LERVARADNDPVARRRSGVALPAGHLDFAAGSVTGRRGETIRAAARRNGADALRARLFHESTPSAERRWQRSADRGFDRAVNKNGTGSRIGQPVGCHRGTGAGGRLCECSAPVDPIGSDTRIQQRESARGPRPFALRRTLPKRSTDASGHRRVCDCGTAGDGVIREVDGPLTNINGTQPRMNANEVIADRAQAQFGTSSAASKVA